MGSPICTISGSTSVTSCPQNYKANSFTSATELQPCAVVLVSRYNSSAWSQYLWGFYQKTSQGLGLDYFTCVPGIFLHEGFWDFWQQHPRNAPPRGWGKPTHHSTGRRGDDIQAIARSCRKRRRNPMPTQHKQDLSGRRLGIWTHQAKQSLPGYSESIVLNSPPFPHHIPPFSRKKQSQDGLHPRRLSPTTGQRDTAAPDSNRHLVLGTGGHLPARRTPRKQSTWKLLMVQTRQLSEQGPGPVCSSAAISSLRPGLLRLVVPSCPHALLGDGRRRLLFSSLQSCKELKLGTQHTWDGGRATATASAAPPAGGEPGQHRPGARAVVTRSLQGVFF